MWQYCSKVASLESNTAGILVNMVNLEKQHWSNIATRSDVIWDVIVVNGVERTFSTDALKPAYMEAAEPGPSPPEAEAPAPPPPPAPASPATALPGSAHISSPPPAPANPATAPSASAYSGPSAQSSAPAQVSCQRDETLTPSSRGDDVTGGGVAVAPLPPGQQSAAPVGRRKQVLRTRPLF